MKKMRFYKKLAAVIAAAAVTAVPMSTMTASATTVGDVIGAAYAAGWPD